jgi:hypothetical protein
MLNKVKINFNMKPIYELLVDPIIDKLGNKIHIEHYNFKNKGYLKEIYALQNKEYRKFYINPDSFSYKSHLSYFNKLELMQNINIFIIKNEKKFVGYIKTVYKEKNTEVSIAINKKFQGLGISSKILKYLVDKNFFLNDPCAIIKKENFVSLKAFKKAGFSNITTF